MEIDDSRYKWTLIVELLLFYGFVGMTISTLGKNNWCFQRLEVNLCLWLRFWQSFISPPPMNLKTTLSSLFAVWQMCIRKQQKEVIQYYIKSHRKWLKVMLTVSKVFSFLKPHGISQLDEGHTRVSHFGAIILKFSHKLVIWVWKDILW